MRASGLNLWRNRVKEYEHRPNQIGGCGATCRSPERFRAKVQGGTSRGLRTSDLATRINPEVHP
jgi:hypothetical protein